MADLLLGPMLRYVSASEATVWVETDCACSVEILDHRASTFHVEGHHFAIVAVSGLAAGSSLEYEVLLDGEQRWPEPAAAFPASRIRTLPDSSPIELVFGSCRVTAPDEAPYTFSPDQDARGFGVDALIALALRLRDQDPGQWPQMLLMIGDQVYADEVSPETLAFIRSRRDVREPPGEQVANFEEYARLYREAWKDPPLRWLLSTIPTAMIFDDHDIHDDWNTSQAWVEQMRTRPWWRERITSALMSYWIYQHVGNLSPADLERDEIFRRVTAAPDAGQVLREFAAAAEREGGGSLWSFTRDLGRTRLVVLDGREGRVLSGGRRDMMDEQEWQWLERQVSGDFDHLLIANTLPVLLAPTVHYLEAWNDAVCAGAWGAQAARLGERLRQKLDLEHWAAFQGSFHRLIDLVREVGAGRHGVPPASIVMLGGDIHQAYLQEAAFGPDDDVRSAVYQAVCSPFRNPLDRHERALLTAARSRPMVHIARWLAHAAGVRDPEINWQLAQEPTFDNQVATLRLDGRKAALRIERTVPAHTAGPALQTTLERRLA